MIHQQEVLIIGSGRNLNPLSNIIYNLCTFRNYLENLNDVLCVDIYTSVLLYRGFREALTYIVECIRTTPKKILVIHGVPNVGKTSLCHVLTFFLGVTYGESCYRSYRRHPNSDSKRLAEDIKRTFAMSKVTCLDHVCFENVEMTSFVSWMYSASDNIKVVFTSGHSFPTTFGQTIPIMNYQVISMQATPEDFHNHCSTMGYSIPIDFIKIIIENCTSVFGRVLHVVTLCERKLSENPEEWKDEAKNAFDEMSLPTNFSFSTDTRLAEFCTYKWAHIIQTDSYVEHYSDTTMSICDWKLFHKFLTSKKDPNDQGLNLLLHYTDIRPQRKATKRKGATEEAEGTTDTEGAAATGSQPFKKEISSFRAFDIHECEVYFENDGLLERIKACFVLQTKENLYKTIFDMYETGSFQGVEKGILFEKILSICAAPTRDDPKVYGVDVSDALNMKRVAAFCKMDEYKETSTISGLVELMKPHPAIEEKNQKGQIYRLCVNLNVLKSRPFYGYDFAAIYFFSQPDKGIRILVNLLQVTINPEAKTKKQKCIMQDMLKKIREKANDPSIKFCPCFVAPFEYEGSCKIDMPCDKHPEIYREFKSLYVGKLPKFPPYEYLRLHEEPQ